MPLAIAKIIPTTCKQGMNQPWPTCPTSPRTLRLEAAVSVLVTADDVAADTDDVAVAVRDDIGGRTAPVV